MATVDARTADSNTSESAEQQLTREVEVGKVSRKMTNGNGETAQTFGMSDTVKRRDRRKKQRFMMRENGQRLMRGMFWNGRGIVDKVDELTMFMEREEISYCMISESRNYGRDLSRGRWKWLAGAECLPEVGCPTPPKGLGALINMDRLPNATIVKSTTCALWIRVPGLTVDLYVAGIYLPCGPSIYRQSALEAIGDDYKTFRSLGLVLLGGDMNARCSMNGDMVTDSRGRRLMEFAYERNLTVLNARDDLCSGMFTRELLTTTAGARVVHRTTIDYVMVPDGQVKCVDRMQIIDDSGLISDHKPILLVVAWQCGKNKQKAEYTHLKWRTENMAVGDWNFYEALCSEKMVHWNRAFDEDKTDPQRKLERGLATFVGAMKHCALAAVGQKKVGRRAKGWWKPQLTELVRQRRALHDRARTTTGQTRVAVLAALGRARRLLRTMCRRSRRAWERDGADNIDRLGCSSRQFNSRWRRHMESVDRRVPDAVVDGKGGLVTQPTMVLAAWREYLCGLCADDTKAPGFLNGAQRDSKFDDGFARRVLSELKERSCGDDGRIHELDAVITWDEVLTAVSTLADGKTGGDDGLVGELVRRAGVAFATAITNLFNHIWKHGVWPEDWRKAYMIPLYKGDGLLTDPTNYRLLALTSVLAKSFEKVLDARLRSWSERVGGLSDLQGGFRAGRGCSDQMFALFEIVAQRKESKQPTALAFLDVAKAYDRVWRPGLWHKLRALGVSDKVLTMLQAMFDRVSRNVLINGEFTTHTDLQTGVPQGAVLSPYLYAVFIDGLTKELREANLGVQIFGAQVALLLFADDIVILANNELELQRMLQVVADYASRWRFEFNHRKCGVMMCGTVAQRRVPPGTVFLLAGEAIAVVEHYKYLGVDMSGARGQWNVYIDRMYQGAQMELRRLAWKSGGFRTISLVSLRGLWASQIRPVLEYAAELWEGNISESREKKLESLQNQFAKMAIGFSKWSTPAASGVRAEVALPSLKSRRRLLKLGFWDRLCTMDSGRVVARVFRGRLEEVKNGGAKLSCLQSMRNCMTECGLATFWSRGCSTSGWKAISLRAVRSWETERELMDIGGRRSLDWFSKLGQFPGSLRPAPYLLDRYNCKGTRLLTFARLGQLLLLDRISKMVGWPEAGATCMLCDTLEKEDLWHFLLVCPFLKSCRERLSLHLVVGMQGLGIPGATILDKFGRSDIGKMEIILGQDHTELALLVEEGRAGGKRDCELLCGKVRYQVDKTVKNFLVACWRLREAAIGRLRVSDGRVVNSRPGDAPRLASLMSEQGKSLGLSPVAIPMKMVDWWVDNRSRRYICNKRSLDKAAFYVVFRGWRTGIFYKWSDCELAMRKYAGPSVKGFRTLAEACDAWREYSSRLQTLNLTYCRAITDGGVAHLAGLAALQTLNLTYCRAITDGGVAHLAGLAVA